MSALIAPISAPGTLLSQLASTTSPSSGLARTISSISMASRLRYSIALGFIRSSPSEIVPNSAPTPPASSIPALTSTARSRSGRLQGFRSLAEFAMPITGRSAAWLTARPALASATRCSSATSSSPASQARLRRRDGRHEAGSGTPRPGRAWLGLRKVELRAGDPLHRDLGAADLLPGDGRGVSGQVQAARVKQT